MTRVFTEGAAASAAPSSSKTKWLTARRRDRLIHGLFLAPALVYVAAFYVYPILFNFVMSTERYTLKTFFTGEAPFIGLDNFKRLAGNPDFGMALWNTVVFTVGSLLFQFILGLLVALFFQRKFPLNVTLRALILIPWLAPVLVSGAVWVRLLDQDAGVINFVLRSLGLISTNVSWLTDPHLSLISVLVANIWIGIPFNMVILYGGLQAIPKVLYEAASIDGAGPWQRFRYVTWPMLRPVATVVLLLGLVYTLKVFDVIMSITRGGPANTSQTLNTLAYSLAFTGQPRFRARGRGWRRPHSHSPRIRIPVSAIRVRRAKASDAMTEPTKKEVSRPGTPRSQDRAKGLGWTLLGLLITGLMLFPMYWIVNLSFTQQTDTLQYPPPFFPFNPTLDGYRDALATIGPSVLSSLIYGIGTVVVTLVVATPAAYALATMRSRVGLWVLCVLILAEMAPGFVVANSLYSIFNNLGLLNSYAGVILANSTLAVPFATIIMRAFMMDIPPGLSEAAMVDGAGHWRIFRFIYLPLSRTALVTAGLFSFLFGWGDFLFALVLNNDPDHTPMTVGIYRFIGSTNVDWPAVMATAVIATIPAALLLTVAQRYVAVGITAGAIKE